MSKKNIALKIGFAIDVSASVAQYMDMYRERERERERRKEREGERETCPCCFVGFFLGSKGFRARCLVERTCRISVWHVGLSGHRAGGHREPRWVGAWWAHGV